MLELLQLRHDRSHVNLDVVDGDAGTGVGIAVFESSSHAIDVSREVGLKKNKLLILVGAGVILQFDLGPMLTGTVWANLMPEVIHVGERVPKPVTGEEQMIRADSSA